MTNDGEIVVQASTKGGKVTLDPIQDKALQVYCKEVESTLPCGFRSAWVSGERDGAEFDLMVGAGVGSPWMTFSYKGHHYCVDVKDILEELFKFADGDTIDEKETLKEQLRQAHVVIQALNEQLALKS